MDSKFYCNSSFLKRTLLTVAKGASAFLCVFAIAVSFSACKANQGLVYATVETTAISSAGDDVYVLRVQGKGVTKEMAHGNALRQAVHDVMFKNIHSSYGNHQMILPILNNPSIEQQKKAFFDDFYVRKYLDFVGDTQGDEAEFKSSTLKTVIINVVVDRKRLKEYLKENNIL